MRTPPVIRDLSLQTPTRQGFAESHSCVIHSVSHDSSELLSSITDIKNPTPHSGRVEGIVTFFLLDEIFPPDLSAKAA